MVLDDGSKIVSSSHTWKKKEKIWKKNLLRNFSVCKGFMKSDAQLKQKAESWLIVRLDVYSKLQRYELFSEILLVIESLTIRKIPYWRMKNEKIEMKTKLIEGCRFESYRIQFSYPFNDWLLV